MARTQKSSLAATLKQTRPFVSLEQEVYLSILRTASEMSYSVDQFFLALQHYAVTIQRLCGYSEELGRMAFAVTKYRNEW